MIFFDTRVLLDIATADPVWLPCSENELCVAAAHAPVLINPIIYAGAGRWRGRRDSPLA
jgi:hypothetical protein